MCGTWHHTLRDAAEERGTHRTLAIPRPGRGTAPARLHGSQRTVSWATSPRLSVLCATGLQARAGLSVLPLMTAAAAHMPTREPAHLVIHPVAPTDADREEPSTRPQGRCPPSAWRQVLVR